MLRGPSEKLSSTLATLRAAQICAEPAPQEPEAIQALFYGADAERPTPALMDACTARATEAALGTSFAVEETGTLEVSRSRQLACRRDTGEWLGAYIDVSRPPEQRTEEMEVLAREAGIAPEEIELREPPVTSLLTE